VITTWDTIMLVSLKKRTKYEIRESINIQGQPLLADLSLDH
jgi:hypothetical protein